MAAWTTATLAVTGNTLNAFFEIDGWLWDGTRFAVSVLFTVAFAGWLLLTIRARSSKE